MDCQAVQARVVEKVGLQIRGVAADFQGLLTSLVGEYKAVALKMLAAERLAQGRARDDPTPTHYENRLAADVGPLIGLNADDVRRAALDEHARARFARLRANEAQAAADRCRALFDLEALLSAIVSELNSFNASSLPNSMPRLFLDWALGNMIEKHLVFDEETLTHVEVDCTLVKAILEVVFLGQLAGAGNELYRGGALCNLFVQTRSQMPLELQCPVDKSTSTCTFEETVGHEVLAIKNSSSQQCPQGDLELHVIIGKLVSGLVLGLIQVLDNMLQFFWPGNRPMSDASSSGLQAFSV